jgi:apoptosis-inducing factor 2
LFAKSIKFGLQVVKKDRSSRFPVFQIKMATKHEILILGGNVGGVDVAHYLLRHTIPALSKAGSTKEYHVTIVSPSTHFFWKIAAPRALTSENTFKLDTLFKSISDGFSKYPTGQFTYVQGAAISISSAENSVTVKKYDSSEQAFHYDSLVIATGTSSNSPLWTLQGDHSVSENAFRAMHAALPEAKTVLVAGGGAVGTETTGEIKSAYTDLEVTILSGTTRLLERSSAKLGKRAEDALKSLSVEVIHNVKVTSSEPADGKTKLKLSDGSEKVVDIYIDATGGKPNTEYVPTSWLNDRSRVKVDPTSCRVIGVENVYAIGDASDLGNQTYMVADASTVPLCSSIGVDLAKGLPDAGKQSSPGFLGSLLGKFFGSPSPLTQKNVSLVDGIFLVPLGKTGVGQLFNYQIPAFMVNMIKGKSYFTEMVPALVSGDKRAKA